MTTETMTIHEALAELKTLDARITKMIENTCFIRPNKHTNAKVDGVTIETAVKQAEESYQSIMDLLKRRAAIRSAVSHSNAATTVIINGTEYTVAQAIEMKKHGMLLYDALIGAMQGQLSYTTSAIQKQNDRVETQADAFIQNTFGNNDKANNVDTLAIRQQYIEANSYEPLSIAHFSERLAELDEFCSNFEAAVDSKLSVSNALTTITVEY